MITLKKRPFITAEYYLDSKSGKIKISRPQVAPCPNAASNPSQSCKLVVKGDRIRKSGPEYPLIILKCKTHSICFTVYPEGWSPYSRKSIGIDDKNSFWNAAIDASNNILWTVSTSKGDESRTTQMRRIKICTNIIHHLQTNSPKYSYDLGIDISQLENCSIKIRDGPKTRKALGTTIKDFLDFIPKSPNPTLKLLGCFAQGSTVINWN
jgi:hypothetical protein